MTQSSSCSIFIDVSVVSATFGKWLPGFGNIVDVIRAKTSIPSKIKYGIGGSVEAIKGENTPELTAMVRVRSYTAAIFLGGTLSSIISKLILSIAPILPMRVRIAVYDNQGRFN